MLKPHGDHRSSPACHRTRRPPRWVSSATSEHGQSSSEPHSERRTAPCDRRSMRIPPQVHRATTPHGVYVDPPRTQSRQTRSGPSHCRPSHSSRRHHSLPARLKPVHTLAAGGRGPIGWCGYLCHMTTTARCLPDTTTPTECLPSGLAEWPVAEKCWSAGPTALAQDSCPLHWRSLRAVPGQGSKLRQTHNLPKDLATHTRLFSVANPRCNKIRFVKQMPGYEPLEYSTPPL
mmetsp:Transcript_22308/g.30551  ORF Transcript_22308/g.30551 Transcript_22308/m.30551 type:complete len:232 (-) Transcript_22308:525-1220(-)